MAPDPASLAIVQVSSQRTGGGAAGIAAALARGLRERGQRCWIAAGDSNGNDETVRGIGPRESAWSRWWSERTEPTAAGWRRGLRLASLGLAHPLKAWDRVRGHEDFRFPQTAKLMELGPERPRVVHCHNLHGGYFDLRRLPDLTHASATFLTLHDAWLLSGHCAHSFGCERWVSGCGSCPDLRIPPEVLRDATAFNWRRKQEIMRRSRLRIATPSRWLMEKAARSLLAPAIIESRVIPNGVDLEVFIPGDRIAARSALGIPPETQVLAFSANGIRGSRWKDYPTLLDAIGRLGAQTGPPLVLLAVGEGGAVERTGRAEMRFIEFRADPSMVARALHAADAYVHPARADTFPSSVLEALACGVPVVASAVGGIPEQVEDGVTGLLVPPGDGAALASALGRLLGDAGMRGAYAAAAISARPRFDEALMVERYLAWYREALVVDHAR